MNEKWVMNLNENGRDLWKGLGKEKGRNVTKLQSQK